MSATNRIISGSFIEIIMVSDILIEILHSDQVFPPYNETGANERSIFNRMDVYVTINNMTQNLQCEKVS